MSSRLRVGVVVNDLETVEATQTTWMLAHRLAENGHETLLLPAWRLGFDSSGQVTGFGVTVEGASPKALVAAPGSRVPLTELDLIIIRTNPARDDRPGVADVTLMLLARVHAAGTPVVNAPLGLWRASSKLYLGELEPDLRPTTLVTREVTEARQFVAEIGGRCVLKPVTGTRGRDVFVVDGPDAPNLAQIVEVIARSGPVMVQNFVPEATRGDIRVVLLDGAPLVLDGHYCAVRRQPGKGDFRSNIHAGGTAVPADLTETQIRVAERVAARLKQDGISLAGMDLIGHQVVEINVFSTGGFRDAERFTGADFTGATLDWMESVAREHARNR